MEIKQCEGYELQKEKPNTSEDFFNRSDVTFTVDGEERVFHLLYVRYFDEFVQECTPFEEDPLFTAGNREVTFRDIVALVFLMKNPGYRERKRVYINQEREFKKTFEDMEFDRIKEVFEEIETKGSYEVRSPLQFIRQPQ